MPALMSSMAAQTSMKLSLPPGRLSRPEPEKTIQAKGAEAPALQEPEQPCYCEDRNESLTVEVHGKRVVVVVVAAVGY